MVIPLPPSLSGVFNALRAAGGRAWLVGGVVRDAWLGADRAAKDYDVEVFGLEQARLEDALRTLGRVDTVGEAFTVYKLSGLEGVGGAVDVSLPRRDSKAGPGHRGIAVVGDPSLGLEDAARRRDFTMNAMMYDPLADELADPHGGRADLDRRLLRAVDPATFGEDPLRALRAVQFAARFLLAVEPQTARLCAAMPIAELPAERIFGEIEKLLLQAARPSRGFALLREWGMRETVCPELQHLEGTPQDPQWHPEGDVWTHTLQAIDEAAPLRSPASTTRAPSR